MTAGSPPLTGGRRGRTVFNVVFAATVGQLLLATLAPHLPQFEGKAFGARLLFYPLMMLLPPVIWIGVARRRGDTAPPPSGAGRVVQLHPPQLGAVHSV